MAERERCLRWHSEEEARIRFSQQTASVSLSPSLEFGLCSVLLTKLVPAATEGLEREGGGFLS